MRREFWGLAPDTLAKQLFEVENTDEIPVAATNTGQHAFIPCGDPCIGGGFDRALVQLRHLDHAFGFQTYSRGMLASYAAWWR